jgi:hypothetical protein
MRNFQNKKTARYRAAVVPADAREGDYGRQAIYYLEAVDYWEAKRTLDVLFGGRRENLPEA